MFVYLCTALMELNKVYSLPVFIFVLLRLISSSVCLYESVYIWISGNEFLEKLIPAMSTYWFVGFFNISIIACAADSPINEVKAIKLVLLTQSCFTTQFFLSFKIKKLRETVFEISSKGSSLSIGAELEACLICLKCPVNSL